MAGDVSISAEVTWKKMPVVRQDFSLLLKQLCQIIKQDIQEGIVDRRQIDGSPMPTLEPATIMEKSGRGHVRKQIGRELKGTSRVQTSARRAGVIAEPDHQLIDTGNLLSNQLIEVSATEGVITIGSTRKEIAMDLQIYGVGKTAKKFQFFGISKIAQSKIETYLRSKNMDFIMTRV